MPCKRAVRIAVSQFPVSADVRANGRWIRRCLARAAREGADLLQTPETSLSGYAAHAIDDWADFDWGALAEETDAACACARDHGIWLALGSSHYLSRRDKPTNCLYLISDRGRVVDRYDKRYCTGGDLKMYTAGDHPVTWTLKGFRFGMLICYDGCFPRLYEAYERAGVEIMIHSFYNAGHARPDCLDQIGPAWVQVRAADHAMWVFASNASHRHSCWPSMVGAPDGTAPLRLARHRPGVGTYEVTAVVPPDPKTGWMHMAHNRARHRRGALHNGRPSRCRRALDRRCGAGGPELTASGGSRRR